MKLDLESRTTSMLMAVRQSFGQAEGRKDMAGGWGYAAVMVVGNVLAER